MTSWRRPGRCSADCGCGVGKTMLSVALARAAAEAGHKVHFTTCEEAVPACPHCRKPVAIVAWLVPPAAASVATPPRHAGTVRDSK